MADQTVSFEVQTFATPARAAIMLLLVRDSNRSVQYEVIPSGQTPYCKPGPYLEIEFTMQNQGEEYDYLWWRLSNVENVLAQGISPGTIRPLDSFAVPFSAIGTLTMPPGAYSLTLEVGHGSIIGLGVDETERLPITTTEVVPPIPDWLLAGGLLVAVAFVGYIIWKKK